MAVTTVFEVKLLALLLVRRRAWSSCSACFCWSPPARRLSAATAPTISSALSSRAAPGAWVRPSTPLFMACRDRGGRHHRLGDGGGRVQPGHGDDGRGRLATGTKRAAGAVRDTAERSMTAVESRGESEPDLAERRLVRRGRRWRWRGVLTGPDVDRSAAWARRSGGR